jgi:hypothetical protein
LDNQTNETGIYGGILMKTALEKILEYKVKDGRITSQSDKEQWTCLQKIIAINKLIVDYHNAFVELRESYQDLLDRYNVINAEWDVLKTDMEAIATEWTQFKPLVNQIINLWENTITPTFEEWTTLMNNWGNTMNGYASTMADYQQTMMEISQSFQNIENEWSAITLAVRGNYEIENVTISGSTNKDYNFEEYNDFIIVTANGSISCLIRVGSTNISTSESTTFNEYKGWGFHYKGNAGNNNSVYEYYTPSKVGSFWTDPTDTSIRFVLNSTSSGEAMIFKRHIPYFSADQSSEVQEAVTKANEALAKATTVDETVLGLSGAVSELQNRAFGLVLHDFNMTPIPTNQTLTNTSNSRQAWSHIVVIWNADASSNPTFTSLYIPVLAIPETGTRQFASSDDKYSVAEIGWNNSGLTIKNIPTSSQNAIRFVGLF